MSKLTEWRVGSKISGITRPNPPNNVRVHGTLVFTHLAYGEDALVLVCGTVQLQFFHAVGREVACITRHILQYIEVVLKTIKSVVRVLNATGKGSKRYCCVFSSLPPPTCIMFPLMAMGIIHSVAAPPSLIWDMRLSLQVCFSVLQWRLKLVLSCKKNKLTR